MSHSAKAKKPVIAAVIDHWVAGLIFAMLMSAFVVSLAENVPILREIQDRGVDATMRLRAEVFPFEPIGTEGLSSPMGPAPPAGYIFIDLDPNTCLDVERNDPRCNSRSPASAAAAARVAETLLNANPRVIIIDARLWDVNPKDKVSPEVEGLLRHAAERANGDGGVPAVPVVAVAPAGPTGGPGHAYVDWSQVPDEVRDSSLHFAPALLWPSPADDIARSYSKTVCTPVGDGKPGASSEIQVDTLPYLAARFAMAGPSERRRIDPAVGPNLAVEPEPCPASGPKDTRTLFTLEAKQAPPSKAIFGLPTQADAQAHKSKFYNILSSSEIVGRAPAGAKAALLHDASQFDDQVVVIGFAGVGGLDRHSTPLGEMSGAELILNATRSFAAAANLRPATPGLGMVRELSAALICSLPFLAFWLVALPLWRRASAVRRFLTVTQAAAGLVIGGAYVAAVLASAYLGVWAVGLLWGVAIAHGQPVDTLMPVVVLALEAFSHAATHVSEEVHEIVGRWRTYLAAKLGALTRRASVLTPKAGGRKAGRKKAGGKAQGAHQTGEVAHESAE